ncbi:MAG TPA: YdcF family protein [Terriglobales bacterium]|nr:YdcF family protein [Terriglobales bacterium]
MTAIGAVGWLERTALLQRAANLWVVSDPITPADAVVVLGGGADVRPFVAADLYAKGLVRRVLVSQVEDAPSAKIGVVLSHDELNLRILRKLGVPDSAIERFGNGSRNTWDEAVALRGWTKQHSTSALIIPTEVFFARRARWVFNRHFSGTGIRIEVPSFDPPNGYSRANWWKTEGGFITFQNEVLKYLYYRLKY